MSDQNRNVVKHVAIVSTVAITCYGLYNIFDNIRRNRYAASLANVNSLNQHERGKFMEIAVPKRLETKGHTHGLAAANRSAGSAAAAAYAYSIGKTPFYMSMSAADQRAGKDGERTMHWAKDFNAKAQRADPGKDSVLVMIDVDEHINDLPAVLHRAFLPAIIYTFQPTRASGTFNDYRYTFNSNNEVVYDVAGGGKYVHEVWDYSPDCVTMRKKFLGITYSKSFFTVEKRYMDENHQLILLTPLAKFGPLGCLLSYNVSGDDFTRLRPVQGDFIRLAIAKSRVHGESYDHLMSTSRVGAYNAANISIEADDALAMAARNSDSKLSPFQVKSMVPGIDNAEAVTLVDYHRMKVTKPAQRVVIPTDAVNNYTYNPVFTTEEKMSVKPFMAPILPECYAPTQSLENDEAMVEGRIRGLATEPVPLEEKEMKYAHEFAKLLKAETGELEPVGHEEIVSRLSRPSQRRITDEASFAEKLSKSIQSFMKKEAYQKPTDPRPIATINGKDKYEYSSYTYAVSEALKRTSWYAFGRKPRQISERVAAVCAEAMHIILTDLSRFDGRVNLSLRQLEEIVMKALFSEKHWEAMLALMRKQYGGKGTTKLGVKYKNGYNRQSGSPETAIFNTICNAFMAYVTFREAGCEPEEAYRKLGVYGGDDGATPDVDRELYVNIAAKFGHVLEADIIKRGEKGVTFLSRLYSPSVWFGDTSSCADIARALSKFHVAVVSDVPNVDKLFEKSFALFLTDAETPIIGDFVSRVVEVSGKGRQEYKNSLNIWNSELPEEDQYPNINHDYWMNEILVDQKLDGFKLQEFREWLHDVKTMEDFLSCPSFIDKPDLKRAKVEIKVNDELVESENAFAEALAKYLAKKKGDAPTNKPSQPTEPQTTHVRSTKPAKGNKTGPHQIPTPMPGTDHPKPQTGPTGDSGTGDRSKSPATRGCRGHNRRPPVPDGRSDGANAHKGDQNIRDRAGTKRTWKIARRNTVAYANPPKDLTTEGIEPNPGPNPEKVQYSDYPGYSQAAAPIFDDFVDAAADLLESSPAAVKFAREANGYLTETIPGYLAPVDRFGRQVGDFVRYVTDPIVDLFAERKSYDPVKLPLVGIEPNPGPVVIPVKGNKVKQAIKAAKASKTTASIPTQAQRIRQPASAPGMLPLSIAPVSMVRGRKAGVPKFTRTSADSMIIEHTELVTLVTGSSAFTTRTIPMQPGLASSFRWLSTQVAGWEKYKWRKLRAWYETRTGTNIPGSVVLLADYDAADPPPQDEFEASTYHGSVDDAPWKELEMTFNMRRSRELFLRTGPLAQNLDIKTYDFANLFICTVDGTAVNWGKVFIEYEIELINTQMLQNVGSFGGSIVGAGTASGANIYGTVPITVAGSYLSGPPDASGNVFLTNLVVGNEYQVLNQIGGTGITAIVTNIISGLTLKTNLQADLINGAGTAGADLNTYVAISNIAQLRCTATATTVSAPLTVFTITQLATASF